MRNITLKTTLSALLVTVPLAGAFAESDDVRGLPNVERFYTSSVGSAAPRSVPLASAFAESDDVRGLANVDRFYTSSVGAAANGSYARQLDSALNAAQTNLQPGSRDNAVSPAAAAQVRSEINAIRHAAAQERRANGGELSASSYEALSGQVRSIHQTIHALQNGG